LTIVRQDGWRETRKIVVEIEGEAGKIRVIHMEFGESVDFDRDGKVSESGDDFTWVEEDGERRFRKKSGDDDLILVPIGPFESLHQIRRSDCDYARTHLDDHDSIKPFPDLVACIRTDERRVGKIRFEDNNKRVEIDWIMWE
jgi:hypothetical protein